MVNRSLDVITVIIDRVLTFNTHVPDKRINVYRRFPKHYKLPIIAPTIHTKQNKKITNGWCDQHSTIFIPLQNIFVKAAKQHFLVRRVVGVVCAKSFLLTFAFVNLTLVWICYLVF